MSRFALSVSLLVMAVRGVAIVLFPGAYDTGVFYMRPWFRFDSIAVGCWLALTRLPTAPRWSMIFSASALVSWSLYGEQISRPLFITIQTLLAATLLFSVLKGGPLERGLFSMRWLRWLGGISYSLYLWQQIFIVSPGGLGWMGKFPLNMAIAFAMAIGSHQFIEKPLVKFGYRRFSRRITAS